MRSISVDTMELDELLATLRARTIAGEMTLADLQWFAVLTRDQLDDLVKADDDDDEAEQAPTGILCLVPAGPLVLSATDGKAIISNAANVFTGYLDSDFRNWGADEPSEPTAETAVVVHELVKDATFVQMFGSLSAETEKLCMTQSQIIDFVKTRREHLHPDGYATFFLFKSKGAFFVASVRFADRGRLCVDVFRFEFGYVWYAGYRHRFVVPQL